MVRSARIDNRAARAARKTGSRYNQIGLLDNKMVHINLCFLGPHNYNFLNNDYLNVHFSPSVLKCDRPSSVIINIMIIIAVS